jgi:hypothetical protein
MCAHLAIKLRADGIHFDASEARIRCMPHTVHLAALEVLQILLSFLTADSNMYVF